MNVDQALAQADTGKEEGLRGLYPVAAQVLANEVRELRELNQSLRAALDKAGYALFSIKRLAPDAIKEFAAKAHEEACKVLDQTASTP